MRRMWLYLDDELWTVLRIRARKERTTVSHLLREAARDRYLGGLEERGEAMQAVVGIRQGRAGPWASSADIRRLRRGSRIDSLHK